MIDHHIVFDWANTQAYGPFPSRSAAEDWLAAQNILLGQYKDNQVSIIPLSSIHEKLPTIL